MIRTVVACIADMIAVSVFLIRVVIIRTVVKVIEFAVAVSIQSSHRAYRCILACVGMFRTVVTCVTNVVTISIFLIRVVIVGAVVLMIENAVVVTVERSH